MFQRLVVNEMIKQFERLFKLGFKTFYINNMQPVGCLPSATRPEFKVCVDVSNAIVSVRHNTLLVSAVANLSTRLPRATFIVLDHFNAFKTALQEPAKYGKYSHSDCHNPSRGEALTKLNLAIRLLYREVFQAFWWSTRFILCLATVNNWSFDKCVQVYPRTRSLHAVWARVMPLRVAGTLIRMDETCSQSVKIRPSLFSGTLSILLRQAGLRSPKFYFLMRLCSHSHKMHRRMISIEVALASMCKYLEVQDF